MANKDYGKQRLRWGESIVPREEMPTNIEWRVPGCGCSSKNVILSEQSLIDGEGLDECDQYIAHSICTRRKKHKKTVHAVYIFKMTKIA